MSYSDRLQQNKTGENKIIKKNLVLDTDLGYDKIRVKEQKC